MKIPFIISLCLLLLTACKKERTPFTQHDVTSLAGPATGATRVATVVEVTYPYSNGCQYIGRFEETRNGNIVTIKAYTTPVNPKAICTMDAGLRTINYGFRATTPGNYELRFLKTDGSFLTHNVTIQ